ncbi:MAG: hypothetical protein ACLQIQ_13885 [Beijerinckiaceae bacterium]
MQKTILTLCLISIGLGAVVSAYADSSPAQLADSGVVTDWVVKDICANASNQPVPADPYYTCPAGTKRRKIQPGDPLPYYNFDQGGTQGAEAYPLLDAQGNPLYVHAIENSPYNQFHLIGDGYDFYSVDSQWLSIPGTRDNGGYGTQFFGANCSYNDGWILFPTHDFLRGGHATAAISGRYWEQNFSSYPGACPKNYEYPVTYWELKKNVPFGGVKGNPIKLMDAMIAYHGLTPGNKSAHLEIFWFTEQYGLTMWQSWIPLQSGGSPKPTANCVVPDTVQLQGVEFVVADCRDWSNVKLATTAVIPQWPLPPANLLQHSHFDDGGGYLPNSDSRFGLWHRGGNSGEGQIVNWSLNNSKAARDKRFGPGVRYLATNCAGTCTGASVQEIYQEISIDQIANNATYLFGIDARSESENGTLQVTLQEIDGEGRVMWQDSVQGTVSPDNRAGKQAVAEDSVYLTAAFIHKLTTIPVKPGATRIRFYITPITSQTFDIVDAWLNRFPAMNGSLGVIQ